MASNPPAGTRFALAVGWRALLIAVLGVIAFETAVHRQYASAAVALAVAAIVILDLARQAGRADQRLGQFIDTVAAADMEWPARPVAGLERFETALARAHTALAGARARQHRETEHLRALVDTATAAMFTAQAGGLAPANRAARRLVEAAPFDTALTSRLAALSPGERCLVRLPAGQRALATATRFTAAEATRVIALQAIEGELDAAEIKAWQDLARILAHEMMNSLTPVASIAQSLKPLVADGPDEVADAIAVIGERSQHLMRFVERYRAAAELPTPLTAPVPVARLFDAVAALLRDDLAGVRFTAEVLPPDLELICDDGLLEQALINLLRNAVDALAGRADAAIRLTARGGDGEIEIAIADNGPGIAPDLLDRVFVPFFTTKPDGSGIGLSLVRQIAVAHRGRADAQSTTDGTTIRLRLPASPKSNN